MTDSTITGWHFSNGRLRDGRPIVVGQWERYKGKILMCEVGYHLSVRALDALLYAPGPYVGRVEGRGDIICHHDKVVCRERRYITQPYDATARLRGFAQWCDAQLSQCTKQGRLKLPARFISESWYSTWAVAEQVRQALAQYAAQNAAPDVMQTDLYYVSFGIALNKLHDLQNAKLEQLLLAPIGPDPVMVVEK